MDIDTVLGIVGTILGILGLITGYVFYRKSLRVKEPCWAIRSNNLIQDNISQMSGLEIEYKGHEVQTLTVSKVLFWNKGFETINRDDIVAANPLRIKCSDDVQLLDTKILSENTPSNRFSIEIDDTKSFGNMTFDYMDKDDGVIIQIIHTGTSSSDIAIVGNIKGATVRAVSSKVDLVRKIILVLLIIVGLVGLAIFGSYVGSQPLLMQGLAIVIVVEFVLGVGVLVVSSIIWKTSNPFPRFFGQFGWK
jgi:hypothetical protein